MLLMRDAISVGLADKIDNLSREQVLAICQRIMEEEEDGEWIDSFSTASDYALKRFIKITLKLNAPREKDQDKLLQHWFYKVGIECGV